VALGWGAKLREIPETHVEVVKQISDKSFWGSCGGFRRCWRRFKRARSPIGLQFGFGATAALDRKSGNYLRLALVEKLKVFFLKSADSVSHAIAHHYRNQHQIYFGAEGGWRVSGGHFRRACVGRSGGWRNSGLGVENRAEDHGRGTEHTGRSNEIRCATHPQQRLRKRRLASRQFYSIFEERL
jgi:hypothetical protein